MMSRIAFALALGMATAASAHGGGLNADGCHNERRTGSYHCHRGQASRARAPQSVPTIPAPEPVYGPQRPVVAAPTIPTPLIGPPITSPASGGFSGRPPIVGIATVLDGDTIQINGQRIRLWGIDAFEAAQRCSGLDGPTACGAQATHELSDMVDNHQVICVYRDTDVYQRTVALCRVGSIDLGASLVRKGLAIAFTRYAQDYVPDEAEARTNRVGAWTGNFTTPSDYRAGETSSVARAQRAPVTGNPTCAIKGNINRHGERIYHMPDDPFYARTNPEAIFCSETEAQAAGFRRAGSP